MQTPEEYVASLEAGDSEKHKTKRAINTMLELLAEREHTQPDEADYTEYRTRSTLNERGTNQNVSRVKKYFAAQVGGEDASMTDEPNVCGEGEGLEQPVRVTTEDRGKAGHKRLDTKNGEVRSERLMLYLTPSMKAEIEAWCNLKQIKSRADFIVGLISDFMSDKHEKLTNFLKISNEA